MATTSSLRSAMKAFDLRAFLGLLALSAALVLSLPGIDVAHADANEDAALQCTPARRPNVQKAREAFRQIEQRLAAEAAAADPSAPRLVVLNTQGYGYGAPLARPPKAAQQAPAAPAPAK